VSDLLLGMDVGTAMCKAAVVDPGGTELAHGQVPTPWEHRPTGAETDPEALFQAAVTAARAALGRAPEGRVRGIGVTSMAETGALLDGRGRPLAPAIVWHDSRGTEEARKMADELGEEHFVEHTGLSANPLCTLVKLRWLLERRREARAAARWLSVSEWVVRRLGGRDVAELSLASRTGLLDLQGRAPFADALAWAGLPEDLLGEVVQAGTPAGTADGADLPEADGAVLTVAGHDHLCAGAGVGVIAPGDVLDSCGTAEAFVRAVAPLTRTAIAEVVAAGVNVGCHVTPGLHALLASIRSGAALTKLLALLGVDPDERGPLETEALAVAPDARGLELHGVASDDLSLTGIGRDASPALAYRVALEAVGAAGAVLLARMASVAGPAHRLVTTGGWAEGEAARAVKARHLGPFEHATAVFAGARGAALTAARAAGVDRPALAVGHEGGK
jgi:sugar (pentulose or hexulose) kinase